MKRYLWTALVALSGLSSSDCAPRAVAAPAEASNDANVSWNQWRGPYRDGTSAAAPWPAKLDERHLVEQWRVPLQSSYSGPIVSGERVFVTETIDERTERVTALDRRSGKILWVQEWPGAMKVPFLAAKNGSWIRSTPACDGQWLYVGGMLDRLVALNVATGEVRWQIDFVAENGATIPAFGCVSSPLIDGDDVYVQAGGAVCRVDKHTGKILWKLLADGGGMNGSAFSSPVIAQLRGVRQLVVQTREQLAGISLADPQGSVLWQQEVPAFRGMNILTPTVVGDAIFTSSYGGKSLLYDLNQNADGMQVSLRWENKLQGYMSSPIVHEGHVYLHLRNRRFACIRLEDGAERWVTQPFGEYWSLIAQGDRLLALDERGHLILIRATPTEFTQLDQRQITDEPAWAHLGNDQDQLFVRHLSGLVVYRWSEPTP